MFEHFDRAAKLAVRFAAEEARRRDERRVGTEHLLLGLLVGAGPELERLTGVGIDETRAGLDAMDREALAAVGVDVDQLDF
ncbi:MAG: Clp protease N-terminal domain-containing protein, partial [Actinomycetes bacterium]